MAASSARGAQGAQEGVPGNGTEIEPELPSNVEKLSQAIKRNNHPGRTTVLPAERLQLTACHGIIEALTCLHLNEYGFRTTLSYHIGDETVYRRRRDEPPFEVIGLHQISLFDKKLRGRFNEVLVDSPLPKGTIRSAPFPMSSRNGFTALVSLSARVLPRSFTPFVHFLLSSHPRSHSPARAFRGRGGR